MIDTEPVITLPMNVPSWLAPEPAPFPFATYKVEPSAETTTAVGYQPTGINPATRMAGRSSRTTATALLPAIATYSVRPSGARASAFGSLPTGARGASATVSCSTTRPVATSTRAMPFEPARATNRSAPRRAMADRWGPTQIVGRRNVRPGAARPHGVMAAPTRARQAEPRGRERLRPDHGSRARVDSHQAVLGVAVVRHQHGAVGERREAEGQGAHRHLTARGSDAPARGEERRAVRERAGLAAGRPGGGGRQACKGRARGAFVRRGTLVAPPESRARL